MKSKLAGAPTRAGAWGLKTSRQNFPLLVNQVGPKHGY